MTPRESEKLKLICKGQNSIASHLYRIAESGGRFEFDSRKYYRKAEDAARRIARSWARRRDRRRINMIEEAVANDGLFAAPKSSGEKEFQRAISRLIKVRTATAGKP